MAFKANDASVELTASEFCMYIIYIWLSAKRCACKGLRTSVDTVVTSDVPTRYQIFCTKQRRKRFFIDSIWHITWPFLNDFILPAAWRVFVRKHRKVCCSLLQWSDIHTRIWCRTCTVRFFWTLLRIFSSFPPIWVYKIKVLWKVASSRAKDLKPVFFILSWVQHEQFYYKAISLKSYMQLLIQNVYSISSKTCQL